MTRPNRHAVYLTWPQIESLIQSLQERIDEVPPGDPLARALNTLEVKDRELRRRENRKQ